MRYAKLLLAFALVLFIAPIAHAKDVEVGVYVLNLGKFDVTAGTFTADFYIDFKCSTNCSPEGFEFVNGRATSMDKIIDEPNEKFYRIQAALNSPMDLKKFPFDSQKIGFIIEDKTKTIKELRYLASPFNSALDDEVFIPGWGITGWDVFTRKHNYDIYNETYSQFVFNIDISRFALSSFLKTFLPVMFIILIVLFSFIMDPDKLTTRIAMVSSGLLAAVMFHVSISNQIPSVGYLTFADKFMILTYFVLLLSFLINIVMLEFTEQKKAKLVQKIHHYTEFTMFILVPVLYVLLFLILL
jgi:hypothetical protein